MLFLRQDDFSEKSEGTFFMPILQWQDILQTEGRCEEDKSSLIIKMTKERESRESEESMAQLQLAEQGLQNMLMQKQMFQLELVETENALEELKKTKDGEVFRIVGSLMLKANKQEVEQELKKKSELLELRLKAIEKQEDELKSRLIRSREELVKRFKSAK